MTFYITLSLSAFLISLLGTRLLILALRRRPVLVDIPNLRSNHTRPTPKGGGIAVVMALVICLLVADLDYSIVLSLLLLTAISLLDDLIGVPISVRFLVQVIAVAIPLSAMQLAFNGFFPIWFDKLLIGIFWVWFINLFNFMDGIDGISAAETVCIGIGLCFPAALTGAFPNALSTYALIVAAAGFGFWWWNRHPAKIFLGDVGSVPIGFLLGYLLLLAAMQGYIYAAVILPAYYLGDSTVTLLRRLYQGKKIWQAHSEHYYQRAVRGGWRHDQVVRYILGCNLLLLLLATLSILNPEVAWVHLAMAYLIVCMLLGFFAHNNPSAAHDPSI